MILMIHEIKHWYWLHDDDNDDNTDDDDDEQDGSSGASGLRAPPLGVVRWEPRAESDSVLELSVEHLSSTLKRIRPDPARQTAMTSSTDLITHYCSVFIIKERLSINIVPTHQSYLTSLV